MRSIGYERIVNRQSVGSDLITWRCSGIRTRLCSDFPAEREAVISSIKPFYSRIKTRHEAGSN